MQFWPLARLLLVSSDARARLEAPSTTETAKEHSGQGDHDKKKKMASGGIPNSPWNYNSHETTTFGCCNSTSWGPKAVTAVKWRLLHRATIERWQVHSQQPPNHKKSEPTAVKWRVRNSTRGMKFCVVSWLLSFQVPLGILWASLQLWPLLTTERNQVTRFQSDPPISMDILTSWHTIAVTPVALHNVARTNSRNLGVVARVSRYIPHPAKKKDPVAPILPALCHRVAGKVPCKNRSHYMGV